MPFRACVCWRSEHLVVAVTAALVCRRNGVLVIEAEMRSRPGASLHKLVGFAQGASGIGWLQMLVALRVRASCSWGSWRTRSAVSSKVCLLCDGVVCGEGPPEQIFAESQRDRTRSFLRSIREAKRL